MAEILLDSQVQRKKQRDLSFDATRLGLAVNFQKALRILDHLDMCLSV